MAVMKSSSAKRLDIRERLNIATQGSIQIYDGSTVFDLVKLGLSMEEIYRLVAPRRTLARRVSNGQHLTLEENDSALRIVEILAFADRVFGDKAIALDWLRTANRGMNGVVPMDLLESETGARLVEQSLHQIDHGIYV